MTFPEHLKVRLKEFFGVTPDPQREKFKTEQLELMERLERQLSAERQVLRFDD